MGLGVISKCILGVLSCTYYPVNTAPPVDHSVVWVCPKGIVKSPGRWMWPDSQLIITNRFGQRLVLQLNCPEDRT